MNFSFQTPQLLALLILLPLFIPFVILRYRRDREKAALFAAAAPSNERASLLKELRFRMIISEFLFLLFLALLVIALAGPAWGLRRVNDYRRGVDVILAFDLSRSMNVEDCNATHSQIQGQGQRLISRLERGKQIAGDLAFSLSDVRIGIAIGKGKGVLAVPLTYDSETVLSFLRALDGGIITGSGTNLESLVDAGIAAFQDSIPSRRVILLFSDGEGLSGSFQAAVERAARASIAIGAVGLGSYHGGPVPVPERGPGAPDGFLLALDGNPVISVRQDDLLRGGAERSGGIYVDCGLEDAAGVLENYINTISSESRLQGQRWEANPRFSFFVFAALFCFLASRLAGYNTSGVHLRTSGIRWRRARRFSSVLLCLGLFSSCRGTQGKLLIMEANFLNTRGNYTEAISTYLRALQYDGTGPYAEYGLASVFFSLDESEAALGRYQQAENALELHGEDHNELRYRIQYNKGIIYFERGEYNEAALAFREALKIDSSRIEAKRNLELSLLTDTRRSPPAPAHSPQNAQDNARNESGPVIFDYLRAKEQEQWKSREWVEDSGPSGLDY